MQMTNEEINQRFRNMVGSGEDRIKILAQLNGCTEREIKQVLQQVVTNYHPDENPHCKVTVELNPNVEKGDIPEHVLDLIFDRLDELDKEIKERQDEYNELVAYIGGKL